MTIIIKVPQPDTEWRLVLVTRNTVIHATYGRDATPADLERAGYVLRGGRQDLDCAISDLTAQVREAEDRAEKAEAHIKSLHERARHAQPEKDRATDEELYGLFNSTTMAFPVRAGVLAVAARVRQERCLVARVVSASMSMHVYRRGHDGWAVALGPRFVECERADVPATLARLLGEVSR